MDDSTNTAPSSASKKHQLTPANLKNVSAVPNSITPFKSVNQSKLPPLLKGSTVLPKRRKLSNDNLSTPLKLAQGFTPLIPHKTRNFSTPAPKRILSISDTPIPDLTPPASALNNTSYNLSFDSPSSPNTTLSSPLKSSVLRDSDVMVLNRRENDIDRETRNLIRQIEVIKQYKSIQKGDKSQEVDELILKWRDASKKISLYLYNDFKLKLSKIGGWKEYRKQQREREQKQNSFEDDAVLDKLYEYKESTEYEELDQYEKDEVDNRIKQEELKTCEDDKITDNEEEYDDEREELKQVLKLFGIDDEKFKLIYN